jgi:hypothetical protein
MMKIDLARLTTEDFMLIVDDAVSPTVKFRAAGRAYEGGIAAFAALPALDGMRLFKQFMIELSREVQNIATNADAQAFSDEIADLLRRIRDED